MCAVQYPPEPPETHAVALWAVTRAVPDLTDAELRSLATLVVCGSEDNVVSSRPAVADGLPYSKPCWRDECTLPPPEDRIVVETCTADFRRRTFVVEQWIALSECIGYLNSSLEFNPPPADAGRGDASASGAGGREPFQSGGKAVYSDRLMLHMLLKTGCQCDHGHHGALVDGLVDLARGRDSASAVTDGADAAHA
jgi:hypothetical protein